MKSFKRKLKSLLLLLSILCGVLFAPQIWSQIKYKDKIHHQIELIPPQEFAVVFGAWVKEDYSLSDVTKERVEAGVRLYKAGKVRKLFLSGDNRSNQQAEAMAEYAILQGVDSNDIVIDRLGIDTNDTCKHFAKIGGKAILVTQGYHLPRTMLMCEKSEIDVAGLAADKLNLLSSRGSNVFQIYTTRMWRSTREAALTWLFVFGIYDKLSTEAEIIEQTGE
ncbi:MAG TPA: ElyC/SanA/YdcF family protein [Anaerolineales bacterium]|nr:ElyC/SanA/YdcF family protein [Anaerolineales bacterium]